MDDKSKRRLERWLELSEKDPQRAAYNASVLTDKFLLKVYGIETCENCTEWIPNAPNGRWCTDDMGSVECLAKLGTSLLEVLTYDGTYTRKGWFYLSPAEYEAKVRKRMEQWPED